MRLIALLLTLFIVPAWAQNHGLSMHGELKLPDNFEHYNYAAPNALKGGTLRQGQIGSFDSLNPFSIRGNAARNIRERVFESLLDRHYDEPFALYGLLAESLTTAPDRSSATFKLRREAKFADGKPLTAADVAFTINLLKDKGRPNHRYYYGKIAKVETPDKHTVTLRFAGSPPDRELPLIIGLMPIVPKHIYENRDIQSASLELPVGSGPYEVVELTPGAQVKFSKVETYWGAKLPHNKGRHNFDAITEDYFRDESAAFEAFKAGDLDIWFESNPQRWQSGYTFPAATDGRIVKKTVQLGTPSGLKAFVLNTRRDALKNIKLRQALDLAFDFEWTNKILYGDIYRRTHSYFGNTPLSSAGQPASDAELTLLSKSPISPEKLAAGYVAPESDGSGRDRALRQTAVTLLEEAGYTMTGNRLTDARGKPVELEVLVQKRDDERLALSWRRMLARLGITLNVRLVDSSQYQRRLQNFDFDIIIYNYYASLSPGNEQAYYWGSAAADTPGSRNYAGIKDEGLDAAINALTQAVSPEDFQTAARALDRALMSGHYFVPLFHNPNQWVAHWHYVEHPFEHAAYGARLETWWLNQEN